MFFSGICPYPGLPWPGEVPSFLNITKNLLSFRNINWYFVRTGNDIWYPKIYIDNSVEAQNLVSFGDDISTITSLWYFYPEHRVRYSTILRTKISCSLDYQTYPFDSHECNIRFKNWIGATYRLVLNSPQIYTNDENGNEIGGDEFEMIENGRMNYHFDFKALPKKFGSK